MTHINYKSVCCFENTTVVDNGTFPIETSTETHSYLRDNHKLFYLKDKPESDKNILVTEDFIDSLLVHMRETFTNTYKKTLIKLKQLRDE